LKPSIAIVIISLLSLTRAAHPLVSALKDALAALGTRLAGLLLWVCNIFGTADLLNAFYRRNRLSLADTPGLLAGYFIPILGVPLPLVTHVLVFRLLMRKEAAMPSRVGHNRKCRFPRLHRSIDQTAQPRANPTPKHTIPARTFAS